MDDCYVGGTIEEAQQEIIDEFSDYDDWMDRYQMLIDLGNEQEPLPVEYKTESNLIDGCQSRLWLQADLTERTFHSVPDPKDVSPSRYE